MEVRTYHNRFIEEVPKSLCEVLDKTVRVPQDVQSQYEHVRLLYGLACVVGLDLRHSLVSCHCHAAPLKECKPEE